LVTDELELTVQLVVEVKLNPTVHRCMCRTGWKFWRAVEDGGGLAQQSW